MVQALEEEQENYKSRLSPVNDQITSRSQESKPLNDLTMEKQQIGRPPKSRLTNDGIVLSPRITEKLPSDMDLMKERFTKLLLGEDMSGGGKGVSSALALSNAITNLAASVFGEQKRLEPMSVDRKARWKKEIDWLLSVSDHIVELDNFKNQDEFYYGSKDGDESEKGKNKRKDEKWWIPTPKVPPNGLSDVTKKWLQFQKDSVNQVLKAAMAINAQVLSEMDIPEDYIDSLPKNGRASLGDSIYKSITVEYFDPDLFLSTMDLSSEHKIVDLKDRIEASIVIWRRKMTAKDGKSTWGSAVSLEKRELFEERAETILLIIKHRFPGIPQSSLDISKIQYNRLSSSWLHRMLDKAILESYSRILESLAFTVLSRIDDVLQADSAARNSSVTEQERDPSRDSSPVREPEKVSDSKEKPENA
ncbi:hypothetical protein F0562_024676 [Nyssa sinensis]|uniref:PRONE domain-containing protein n=1 Tax=Nyssa sinensis TaxID=561372 RepID=A0A5J5BB47_9ASTE|nr:hypothetical protein F0562_024676 [Nyssa sinensis]